MKKTILLILSLVIFTLLIIGLGFIEAKITDKILEI